MFEIMSVSGLEVQREIVAALPEVMDDSQHATVAGRLKSVSLYVFLRTVVCSFLLQNVTKCKLYVV